MTTGLRIILMLFAVVGFAGAGASLAVARHRFVSDRESDLGMLAVSVMLLVFATLCTAVASGIAGIFAFGGVLLWASYVVTAQRMGLFRVDVSRLEETAIEGPRQRT
jgi:hypothetical protein